MKKYTETVSHTVMYRRAGDLNVIKSLYYLSLNICHLQNVCLNESCVEWQNRAVHSELTLS